MKKLLVLLILCISAAQLKAQTVEETAAWLRSKCIGNGFLKFSGYPEKQSISKFEFDHQFLTIVNDETWIDRDAWQKTIGKATLIIDLTKVDTTKDYFHLDTKGNYISIQADYDIYRANNRTLTDYQYSHKHKIKPYFKSECDLETNSSFEPNIDDRA